MATILLGAAFGALGGVWGGAIGAIVGRAAGALVGSLVDRTIVNALTPPVRREGPRLTTTDIQTSTEGTPMDRACGRARLTGQVFWATRFEEVVKTEKSGGKGMTPKVVTTTYSYFGNFAVGLCEGAIAGIGRIWADGKEIDQTKIEFRVYRGTEDQDVDALIEAKEGTAPAYRGTAYIVFERMPLESFGNRLPQIAAEVYRPTGALEGMVKGVALITGNEFGFDPEFVRDTGFPSDLLGFVGLGGMFGGPAENRHTLVAATDLEASLDQLQMLAPNLESVMVVVPWFGDDLRAGHCAIRPKVDQASKTTAPADWLVGNLTRLLAEVMSQISGLAAFGGSPSDAALIRAIQAINARGLKVTLCPFLMMDVPAGNTRPNPYSDNAATAGQPVYPWRGRITCSPAAGFVGTVDKTATAASQVAAFVGTVAAGHFGGSGTTVAYSGPNEWSYRRFILHCAKVAQLAGGVEAFLVGSEMIGMTQVRAGASAYPFVAALKTLAADVSGMLPAAKIGYAADWSEYSGHRPGDGSNDVYFHLDPLWSDANIDFVGIDNYFPLADWRDGTQHLDFDPAGPTTIYDPLYLAANVEGGEGYDWYYASAAARDAQTRTPIVDTAEGKHWVFRPKDMRGWWANQHFDRPGGVESAVPTGWAAASKPVRFIEMGCPAVDKGANQPNVFVDPKSSESFYPYFSNKARDDAMQRAYLEAMLGYWADPGNNPMGGFGGRMVDTARSNVWCWDVRPWPSFPLDGKWGDADNWETGHWLNGRLGAAPATDTIRQILDDAGFADHQVGPIGMVVDGVTTGTLSSARAMLDALRPVFQFDAVESDGVVKFTSRLSRLPVAQIGADDLVVDAENPRRFVATRAQETELPAAVKLRHGDPNRDDQPGAAEAQRSGGGSSRVVEFSAPVVMAENLAKAICEYELHAAWTGRERAAFRLPPSRLALDPGDVVDFQPAGGLLCLSDIGDAAARSVNAYRFDPLALAPVAMKRAVTRSAQQEVFQPANVVLIDGPLLADDDTAHAGYIAGALQPFGDGIGVYRSAGGAATFDGLIAMAATIGFTTEAFATGQVGVWDRLNVLHVRLSRGTLASAAEIDVLNGANPLLVENADGEWELLQFASADLTGPRSYALAGLLRGQKGTAHAMRTPLAAGARVVLVNEALLQSNLPAAQIGQTLTWRAGPAVQPVASPGYVQQLFTMRGRGRRPLSPVHLRAAWESDGDIQFSWIRRTRIGGDSWDQVEVPLGEESERYEIEILDGGNVARTVTGLGAPAWLYQVADQAADFGASVSSVSFRVYQMSATFGRGVGAVYP